MAVRQKNCNHQLLGAYQLEHKLRYSITGNTHYNQCPYKCFHHFKVSFVLSMQILTGVEFPETNPVSWTSGIPDFPVLVLRTGSQVSIANYSLTVHTINYKIKGVVTTYTPAEPLRSFWLTKIHLDWSIDFMSFDSTCIFVYSRFRLWASPITTLIAWFNSWWFDVILILTINGSAGQLVVTWRYAMSG